VRRGGAHPAGPRAVGPEWLDCGRAELTRVPAPVKADVTAHPLQISLLSAQREVARAHPLARDRKEARHSVLALSGLAEGRHGAHLMRWKQIGTPGSRGKCGVFAVFRAVVQRGRPSPTFVYNLPGRRASANEQLG